MRDRPEMDSLHPPLTEPDCDLRDFKFMPLDVVRFAQSDLMSHEAPEAIVAAILLWGASWHQVPSASLTDDDRSLANLAGYGRAIESFRKVKAGALRGWIKCSDGRLYHPVVAEKARESFRGKLEQRHRAFLAAVRKHNERDKDRGSKDQRDNLTFEEWDAAGRPKSAAEEAPRALKQPKFDLENDEDVTRDTLNGHEDVTRDEDQCHAFAAIQGRVKGRDSKGTGKGYIIDDGGQIDAEDAAWDSVKLASELCRVAGVRNLDPKPIGENIKTVCEWITAGADPPMIITVVQAERDKASNGISRLSYFDRPMRAAIAKRDHPNGKPAANDFSTIRDPLLRRYLERGGSLGF